MEEIIDRRQGALKLPCNNSVSHVLRYKVPNEEEKNSAILTDYQYKTDTAEDFASLKMFLHLLSVPCFDTLRTKEQLGYIVWSGTDKVRGMWYTRIIIQSAVADPIKLDERIELFLKDFGENTLPKIDKETFEMNKISVINNLLEKPKSIGELSTRYWGEISSLRYEFSRREELSKQIEKLQLNDIIEFYKNYIAQDAPNRSKLSVQLGFMYFELVE